MNFDYLRIFVTVADAGSLTGAARKLDLSVATVGRRIDALEQAVGFPLLRRGKSGISLSEAGRRLLESARSATERVTQVELLAGALRAGRVEPAVRISATDPVITQILAPALLALLQSARIAVEMQTSSGVADFDRHECDLAVRLFRPTGDHLVARRMPDIELALFASPTYLAARDPASLTLADERMLLLSNSYGPIAEVAWAARHGLDHAAALVSSSSFALLQAARAGAGIAIAPRFLADQLVEVPAPSIPPRQCWLVWHADSRRSPLHRKVIAWAADALTSALRPLKPA